MIQDAEVIKHRLNLKYARAFEADDLKEALLAELYAIVHQLQEKKIRQIGVGHKQWLDDAMVSVFGEGRLAAIQEASH